MEIQRVDLEERLYALSKQNREAVTAFAARCALRVLPFTVDAVFDNPEKDLRKNQENIIIASFLGLENFPIQVVTAVNSAINTVVESSRTGVEAIAGLWEDNQNIVLAAASASNAIQTAAYAARACAAFDNLDALINETIGTAIVASPSTKEYIFDDLSEFEKTQDIQKIKNKPLWFNEKSQYIEIKISAWIKKINDLKLNDLALVYGALLHGEKYSSNQILGLINDWHLRNSYLYASEHTSEAKSSAEQTPKTITKYDQTHAHLYDGLAQKDSLGRQHLVDAIADILAAKENTEHQTIGLLGDWGAGKSTFIELLRIALKKRPTAKFLFAEFNAWEYEHTEHMQAGVAREALKGLVTDLGWWQKLGLAGKFSWQEKPWQVIPIVLTTAGAIVVGTEISSLQFEGWQQIAAWFGFGSISTLIIWKFIDSLQALFKSPLVNQWKSLLSLPDYENYLGTIPVMKQQILKLCKLRLGIGKPTSEQRRLLFVVDDLDRCSHGGVVKTLEAVRLIMGIPQVTIIIAIDQRIALASLALHYKDLADYHEGQDPGAIARDYLGKVIQLPVQLNAADNETIAAFINDVLLGNTMNPAAEQNKKIPEFSSESHDSPSIASVSEQNSEERSKPELFPPQLNTSGLNSSPEIESVHEVIEYQLSPAEKSAFKACVAKYQFHNPRQLKRLYNSFNLLRHLYGSDQVGDHLHILFWLEYLNSPFDGKRNDAEKNRRDYISLDDERYKLIEMQVKPFVLPALTASVNSDRTQQSVYES